MIHVPVLQLLIYAVSGHMMIRSARQLSSRVLMASFQTTSRQISQYTLPKFNYHSSGASLRQKRSRPPVITRTDFGLYVLGLVPVALMMYVTHRHYKALKSAGSYVDAHSAAWTEKLWHDAWHGDAFGAYHCSE